jgi:urea transporter
MRSEIMKSLRSLMPSQMTATGFDFKEERFPSLVLIFSDTVLRGIGQVMFQNNSYAGAVFLAGIFYNSTSLGWAALIGTIASTSAAIFLGANRGQIRDGLFGFNGTLIAIALIYFLEPGLITYGYAVLAAIFTTVVMATLLQLLETWRVPALTAPFVFTTWVFVLACANFGHLQSTDALPTAAFAHAATVEGTVTASTVVNGVFSGLAQIFFQSSVITGIFFATGLFISSRLACAAALVGSFVGLCVAWGMGAGELAIHGGAFGFNSALTAIAICSGYFVLNLASMVYGTIAVVTTAVVFAAISAALEPHGVPALTSPFVLVVWIFLLASGHFKKLRTVSSACTR